MLKGIDVSKHQGVIDWNKVKGSGVQFVMIRAGWSHYDGGLTVDERFHENMQGAASVGLDTGVYVYSYDKTPSAAAIAAQRLLELVKPYKLTYPIAFDIEDTVHAQLSKQQNTEICKAFLNAIEAAGYYGLLYSYTNFLSANLDVNQLVKYDKWVADYRAKCGYTGTYGMWQYTGSGKCAGISGDVDWNECYRDYPDIIKRNGLNNLSEPVQAPDYKSMYESEATAHKATKDAHNAFIANLTDFINKNGVI